MEEPRMKIGRLLIWIKTVFLWLLFFAICIGLFYGCMEWRRGMAFVGMSLGP